MKKPVVVGIAFVVAVLAVLIYSTMNLAQYRVEVCMAFNGRHLLVGFASGIEAEDEGIVPRPVLFGNFSLVGVCHAYVDDPVVFKRLSGFNFPAHRDGERLHSELLALFAAGKLRAIVGQHVPFLDLPAALDALEQRHTVGRSVISVP